MTTVREKYAKHRVDLSKGLKCPVCKAPLLYYSEGHYKQWDTIDKNGYPVDSEIDQDPYDEGMVCSAEGGKHKVGYWGTLSADDHDDWYVFDSQEELSRMYEEDAEEWVREHPTTEGEAPPTVS